jgi:1,2-diacylglycerol 3-alpha-glucosyltransferase
MFSRLAAAVLKHFFVTIACVLVATVLDTEISACPIDDAGVVQPCRVAVIWIDWYAYHVVRFQALVENTELVGAVAGIELVGGIGVHAGLQFRGEIPSSLPVATLLPAANWRETNGFKLAALLWTRLKRLNPEVVLVPGYYTLPGIAAALWAKVHRRCAVLMTESTGHDHQRAWWKEALKGALIRNLFDWAVAGGSTHRRYLEALGFPAARIGRYYDVVDNDFFRSRSDALRDAHTAADFGLPAQYFLYVGRLAEEKNVVGLLNAYLQYRLSGGEWSLVFVGDGPQYTRLKELIAASPFSADISLQGLVSTSELPRYYAFAECLVLPSTREPWGLVANEAMASGLPVILSDRCGCVEDLLGDEVSGFSFNPNHPCELLERLLAMSHLSRESRRAMAQKSQEIIGTYSPKAWAAGIAEIVQKAAR